MLLCVYSVLLKAIRICIDPETWCVGRADSETYAM